MAHLVRNYSNLILFFLYFSEMHNIHLHVCVPLSMSVAQNVDSRYCYVHLYFH